MDPPPPHTQRSSIQLTDGGSAKRARLSEDRPTRRAQTYKPPPPPSASPLLSKRRETIPLSSPPLSSRKLLPLPVAPLPADPLAPLQERQEGILRQHMERYPHAVSSCPKAARLLRKLKVHALQRSFGVKPFDMDEYVARSLSQTVKYVVDASRPYYEQITPVLVQCPAELPEVPDTCYSLPPGSGADVLTRLTLNPVLSRPLAHHPSSLHQYLVGQGSNSGPITSPYTARVLKPYILSTTELKPHKVRLLEEVVGHFRRKDGSTACVPEYTRRPVDLCYLQEHHLRAVNALVSQFFWPVDLSECLLYPDFTVVALYGKLVIGCGCMTPDVKVNEAYLSFLLVHPDFCRAGIGRLMLYHLTQTCMGKDISLHVSVDNPAMLLYQQFGFKAEQYCLDFYQRYFPADHHLSKHAYLMRLKR